MLIIGIDPGITGSICFFEDGKIIDVIEMPNMPEGKKNKRQVNGAQVFHEISLKLIQRHQHLKFLYLDFVDSDSDVMIFWSRIILFFPTLLCDQLFLYHFGFNNYE